MKLTQTKLSERHWTVVLLLYLCFVYTPFILSKGPTTLDFLPGDCKYYRAIIVSLLKDGDLLLANNVDDPLNGQLALGKDGLVPKHPIIMPIVSIPFYLAFGDYGLLLFNIINCMILMVLIFKLNCLFFSRSTAFITTTLFATGTLFFYYTYNYSPDVFSTVLLLSGLYLVLKERFFWGAFFLGLSIFAKLPNLPLAGVILFYAGFVILKGATANGDTGQ